MIPSSVCVINSTLSFCTITGRSDDRWDGFVTPVLSDEGDEGDAEIAWSALEEVAFTVCFNSCSSLSMRFSRLRNHR